MKRLEDTRLKFWHVYINNGIKETSEVAFMSANGKKCLTATNSWILIKKFHKKERSSNSYWNIMFRKRGKQEKSSEYISRRMKKRNEVAQLQKQEA